MQGALAIELDELGSRLGAYIAERAPRFRAWRKRVRELLDVERKRLKLHDLVPQVLTTFVRNRLIDEVYLPLLGDNLAKQLGAAGEGKRTDRMGMLLLISPPGYGKTTLMEYVCSRLGLVFMKINGPALGHDVTSLDPADAPNATARQEVERINLAFEMGNNVMLYLDDIQHTSPELLQKFISLCDGQRKIEGVWRGQTKTYDLRGKKFCVAMAGNPYTESGERFRVPDMLANRADTYNLGDILEGKSDVFALSYVENALTSNPVLAPLASRDPADVHQLIRMARGGETNTATLKHGYSSVELQEIVGVLQRLLKVQETVLKVNLQYIASASQDERFRTEPAFKLQGSYRNMSKLAARVVAAMNDEELRRLVDDHYAGEAQTLTSGAEHNLLKLAEMLGRQTPEQKARWDEIKKGFARAKLLGGNEDDPVARVTAQLSGLGIQLETIGDAIRVASSKAPAAEKAGAARAETTLASPELMANLRELREAVLQVAKATADSSARAPAAPVIPAAPATDLAPFLEKLEQTLKAVADKSGPKPKSGVRPPPDWARQVELIEAALSPLRELAAKQLQSGDESLKAMGVWKGVNEALELLRAVRPLGNPAARNQK